MTRQLLILFIALVFTHSAAVAQWVKTSYPEERVPIFSATIGKYLYVGSDGIKGFYRSEDNGNTWQALYASETDQHPVLLPKNGHIMGIGATSDGVLIVGVFDPFPDSTFGGIYVSFDTGRVWVQRENYNVDIFFDAKKYIIGSSGNGFIHSTDSGWTWQLATNNLSGIVTKIVSKGTVLYASTYLGEGVARSIDSGETWQHIKSNLSGLPIYDIIALDTELYTAGEDVYRSRDNGLHWVYLNLPYNQYHTIATSGTTIFEAGLSTIGSLIVYSTDHGDSWKNCTSNLPGLQVHHVFVKDNYLFAGTDSGLWRRPLSELNVVPEIQYKSPNSMLILVPNPTSGSTSIQFHLDGSERVTITVMNLLGYEVARVIDNGYFISGEHELTFKPNTLSTGEYIVRMQTSSGAQSQRLEIIR